MVRVEIPVMPTDEQIRAWYEEGLTRRQMCERWLWQSATRILGRPPKDEAEARAVGQKPTEQAFSARFKKMDPPLPARQTRYSDTLPWEMQQQHKYHYAARMLRALHRRRADDQMSDDLNQRLTSWLDWLAEPEPAKGEKPACPYGKVVDYWPSSEEGFQYVPATRAERARGEVIRVPAPQDKPRKRVA